MFAHIMLKENKRRRLGAWIENTLLATKAEQILVCVAFLNANTAIHEAL